MYCRDCNYRLIGLTVPRCPECGGVFNPHDRSSFLATPPGPLVEATNVLFYMAVVAAGALVVSALTVFVGFAFLVFWTL